jgi:hypothetical protein
MKKIFISLLSVFAIGIVFCGTANAQTSSSASVSGGVLVATVNIDNAKIVSQDDRNFSISFDISNRIGAQPQIKYAVQLTKVSSTGQDVIDEKVYDEVLSLGENTTVNKTINYTVPSSIPAGTYELSLESKNESGLILAYISLGTVNISENKTQTVEIVPGSCQLTVQGGSTTTDYISNGPLPITVDQKIIANCIISSSFSGEISLLPNFVTMEHTVFGSIVSTSGGSVESINIKNGTSRISVELPQTLKPEDYDVEFSLISSDKSVVSNKVYFDYILVGDSGVIENAVFNKTFYKAGDIANIQLSLVTNIASISNVQPILTNNLASTSIYISITSDSGRICGSTTSMELTNFPNVQVPIINDCSNPQANIVLSMIDATGKEIVLDQKNFQINTPNAQANSPTKLNAETIILISAGLIVVLILLAIIIKRKHSVIQVLIIFLLSSSMMFGFLNKVFADTYSWSMNFTYMVKDGLYCTGRSWPKGTDTYYVNTNVNSSSPVYNSNQTISLTYSINSPIIGLDPSCPTSEPTAFAGMAFDNTNYQYISSPWGNNTYSLPSYSTSGTSSHSMNFKFGESSGQSITGNIPFTVVSADQPPVGEFNPISGSLSLNQITTQMANSKTSNFLSFFNNIIAEVKNIGTKNVFASTLRTITATAGADGSINPSGTIYLPQLATQEFTIQANSGYRVSNVTVDGVSQGAIVEYMLPSDFSNHTISATFVLQGAGSTSGGTGTTGGSTGGTTGGGSVGTGGNTNTNTVTGTYTITLSAGSGGLISPSGSQSVDPGTTMPVRIVPDSGNVVSSVLVDGNYVATTSSYSFSRIYADHSISVTFAPAPVVPKIYTITASAGAGGTIVSAGTWNLPAGSYQTFTITPNSDYTADVMVDGSDKGAISTYTFSNVTANHTISATFVAIPVNNPTQPTQTTQTTQSVTPALVSAPVSSSCRVEGWVCDPDDYSAQLPVTISSGATTLGTVIANQADWYSSSSVIPAIPIGTSWVNQASPKTSGWSSVVYGDGKFVAVGPANVMTSSDGINWTSVTVSGVGVSGATSVTYGGGLFVASFGTGIMTSKDGINWIGVNLPFSAVDSVAYGNGEFIVTGSGGVSKTGYDVLISSDGITWTESDSPDLSNSTVTYGNGLFVAVADSGTNKVMTSKDGITWTAQTIPKDDESIWWRSVNYIDGQFVAVADNFLMTSPDGITWTDQTVPEGSDYSVTYGNGLFVAVGQSNVMTSPDGINWTEQKSTGQYSWDSVAYNDGIFAAVSYDGKIMTSQSVASTTTNVSSVSCGGFPNHSYVFNIPSGSVFEDGKSHPITATVQSVDYSGVPNNSNNKVWNSTLTCSSSNTGGGVFIGSSTSTGQTLVNWSATAGSCSLEKNGAAAIPPISGLQGTVTPTQDDLDNGVNYVLTCLYDGNSTSATLNLYPGLRCTPSQSGNATGDTNIYVNKQMTWNLSATDNNKSKVSGASWTGGLNSYSTIYTTIGQKSFSVSATVGGKPASTECMTTVKLGVSTSSEI